MKSISRLTAAFLSMCVLATVLVGNTSVKAGSEVVQPDPVAILRQNHKPIAKGRGWVFTSTSNFIRSQITASPAVGTGRLCASNDDASCSPTAFVSLTYNAILGICTDEIEAACLESVSSIDADGKRIPMKFAGGGTPAIPSSSDLNWPRGTSATRWTDSGGNQYMVSPVAHARASSVNGAWKSGGFNWFNVYLTRIPASNSSNFQDGIVPSSLQFEPGSRFAVKLRLPSSFPSWFQGRLVGGAVSLDRKFANSASYEFSGAPVSIPIPYAELDYATDANLITPMGEPNGYEITNFEPGNSVRTFKEWGSRIEARAITTIQQWSAGSYSATSGGCFSSAAGVVGMMSTNAGSYAQEPPTFDKLTGQMSINVGSSHLNELGELVVGSYSASIPLSVVQCLYGDDFVPEEAEVSISYDDKSVPFTSTQAITIANGQVNLAISGFHYSAPTIALRLKARVVVVPTLKKGSSKLLSSILRTTKAQKPKWSASGQCKISGTKLVALKKSGTCKVTLKVLNSKKKYVVKTTRTFSVK